MGKTVKIGYEDVVKYFADNECTLLSKEYKNTKTKLKFICKCGQPAEKTFESYKKKSKCKECGYKDIGNQYRNSYDDVKKYFEEQNCILLSEEYFNNREDLNYICSCGSKSKISFSNFKKGRRCKNCKSEKLREFHLLTIDDAIKAFEEQGCTLLEKEYVSAKTHMRYICICDNVAKISLDHFKRGKRCQHCKSEKCRESARKYTYAEVKAEFESRNYTLLEKALPKETRYLRCQCPNGHPPYSITFTDFNSGVVCRHCHYDSIRGENHPNWNPDLTYEERERGRLIEGYKDWIRDVYEKDNYTCQCCGQVGRKLNAHHILNYSGHKDLRTETSNGITLCEDCHIEFHKTYGYKHNNREQLNEFLNNHKNKSS